MDRTQQLQCVYYFLQTAVQRPPSVYENAMEILNSRWDATNKEHDWETLGGAFQSPQVWSRKSFSCWQWGFLSSCHTVLSTENWEKSLLIWSAQILGQHALAEVPLVETIRIQRHGQDVFVATVITLKLFFADTLWSQTDLLVCSDTLQWGS